MLKLELLLKLFPTLQGWVHAILILSDAKAVWLGDKCCVERCSMGAIVGHFICCPLQAANLFLIYSQDYVPIDPFPCHSPSHAK